MTNKRGAKGRLRKAESRASGADTSTPPDMVRRREAAAAIERKVKIQGLPAAIRIARQVLERERADLARVAEILTLASAELDVTKCNHCADETFGVLEDLVAETPAAATSAAAEITRAIFQGIVDAVRLGGPRTAAGEVGSLVASVVAGDVGSLYAGRAAPDAWWEDLVADDRCVFTFHPGGRKEWVHGRRARARASEEEETT